MNRICILSLLFLSLLTLTACGAHVPTNLLVIGNSITLVPPTPAVAWSGDWGMAVASPDLDFAHQTAAALNLPMFAINAAALEGLPEGGASSLAGVMQQAQSHLTSGTIVVVELADNAWNMPPAAFESQYAALLTAAEPRQALVCVATFWLKDNLDQIVKRECNAHGGRYVYIGDIKTDAENPDWDSTQFANSAVQGHPHNWSHAHIATRIVETIKGERVSQ